MDNVADMDAKLKLYLWEDVLWDYTPGVMFALAHHVEEAKALVRASCKQMNDLPELDELEPKIIDAPFGFHLYGGG